MKALEELKELSGAVHNRSVEQWKAQGKPVVGYICSYTPAEVFHAAGILPYRIRAKGCQETALVDTVMATNTCSFARCCLELALKGEYRFLDGLVYANTCDTLRRMIDNWRNKVATGFCHFLSVPHKADEGAVNWYVQELSMLAEGLERTFGATITDDKLNQAIRACNERRGLVRKLYEHGKKDNPPLSGSETLAISVLASSMPLDEFARLTRTALNEMDGRNGRASYRARLMTVGNLDDSGYAQIIEEAGGLVVTDASCFGTLSVWEPIVQTGQPWHDIAEFYLKRVTCPRMPGTEGQMTEYVKDMVTAFRVEGVILERVRYCNYWSGATVSLQKDLQQLGIPTLVLDREYFPSGVGQIRTRVQAFLEIVEGG